MVFFSIVCLFELLFVLSVPAWAQTSPLTSRMGARLEMAATTYQLDVAGTSIHELDLVLALYERAAFQPLWTNPENIHALMRWIDRAWEEGLNPADYHYFSLTRMTEIQSPTPEQQIERDLLLTDALVQLVLHLRTGKVDPKQLFKEWNYEPDWTRFPSVNELLAVLEEVRLDDLLAGQLPNSLIYAGLREALEHYRKIQNQGGWDGISPGATMHPGDQGERVVQLRQRLRISGDLEVAQERTPDDFYDPNLEEAVRRFQQRHLLEVDGVVGRRTLAALNVPVEQKIQKIRLNMERLRWLNHGIPNEYLAVDLAGFYVFHWIGRENAWSSPVQVGEPYHQTPIFKDTITYIDINPTWTVPVSIIRKELAPKLLQNPLEYLEKHDMELLSPGGQPVDPRSVDWDTLSAKKFPYVLRQRPGPNNALGRIKFMFPNKYHVYLHDTPSKYLFTKTRRAFSHGCIRVGKPLELAERLLARNRENWDRTRLEAVIATKRTKTVILDHPMPILIMYLTAMPDLRERKNLLQFRPDIYRRDGKVLKALDGPVVKKGFRLLGLQ